jgi:uncharacterized protein YdeI (YjbR/CyaY-like superfamily)
LKNLYVKDRLEWRAWLEKNHASCKEIWLIYYKKDSGKPRIPYDDAVEEALCVGWIDGKIKKLDEERFAQRFTPRGAKSRWSEINIERAQRLIRERRMRPEGLAAFDPGRKVAPLPTELRADLQRELEKSGKAWTNFQQFPPSYRKMTVAWIASAKKDETRQRRFEELVKTAAAKERIKFM